jgi:hypothetical protein
MQAHERAAIAFRDAANATCRALRGVVETWLRSRFPGLITIEVADARAGSRLHCTRQALPSRA